MDNPGSYFKTYRKIIFSDVFMNPNLLQLWIYCLSRASFKNSDYTNGNKVIKLKPGQFRTGRRELALALGINESTAYKRLQALKAMEMVQLKSDRRGTTVTVVNWGKYQDNPGSGNSKSNNTGNNRRNNTDHTIKEIKKDKKEKNNTSDLPEKEMTEEEEFEARAAAMERMKHGNI